MLVPPLVLVGYQDMQPKEPAPEETVTMRGDEDLARRGAKASSGVLSKTSGET